MWTKADRKRIDSALQGGALSMTFGVDPAKAAKLIEDMPLQCVMYGIGEVIGVNLDYIDKAQKMIDWLASPDGARVYGGSVPEMTERQKDTIKRCEAVIRILTRLKAKIDENGLPDRA